MAIKKDLIEYVANLARLRLDKQEEELFARQLDDILAYMQQLNKLDTRDVEPMSHALSMGNVLRRDTVRESLSHDSALKNAPQKKEGFFRVPRVIE